MKIADIVEDAQDERGRKGVAYGQRSTAWTAARRRRSVIRTSMALSRSPIRIPAVSAGDLGTRATTWGKAA